MAFVAAFLAVLAVALLQGAKPFYYDSLNYWMLGKTFVAHGSFSLLNFSSPLRGYLLPLIDHGLQGIAVAFGWRASTSAKIFNVFVFALIGAVLAPQLAEISWPAARRGLGSPRWRYLVALLLCCATSIPSAMETRFLLPIYLLGYILVLAPGWPNPIGAADTGIRRFRIPALIVLAYLVFMAVIWHVVSGASNHFHFS